VDTLTLTAIPLAFGGGILLQLAVGIEGWPALTAASWGLVFVLALINTACVYLLYNHALRTLAAFEVSAILNLTPVVTAGLAWLFLDESLSGAEILGMIAVVAGVGLVQAGKRLGRRGDYAAAEQE